MYWTIDVSAIFVLTRTPRIWTGAVFRSGDLSEASEVAVVVVEKKWINLMAPFGDFGFGPLGQHNTSTTNTCSAVVHLLFCPT